MLLQAQRKLLSLITKHYNTVPGIALPVLAGVFPLDILVEITVALYQFREYVILIIRCRVTDKEFEVVNIVVSHFVQQRDRQNGMQRQIKAILPIVILGTLILNCISRN